MPEPAIINLNELAETRSRLNWFLSGPTLGQLSRSLGLENLTESFEDDFRNFTTETEKMVMEDGEIRAIVKKAISIIEMEVPVEVAVEYAARRTISTAGEIPKNDPVRLRYFYVYVVLPVIRAQQEVIEALIRTHPAITATEKIILLRGMRIAKLFDSLFIDWWQKAIIPYQLGLAQDPSLKEVIKKGGFKNQYAVLVNQDGNPIQEPLTREVLSSCREIPLITAFLSQISIICNHLKFLIEELRAYPSTTGYQHYFQKLIEALENTNLQRSEELWAAVDYCWVEEIGQERVVPVHMMEDGYHHPFEISPEFRIQWRSHAYGDEINLARKGVKSFAEKMGDKLIAKKLELTDVSMSLTVVSGGCGIDFRYAGQSVPNRPKVQLRGMKIFLDPGAMTVRQTRFSNLIERCVHRETLEWLLPHCDLAFHIIAVASHEFSHPILIDEQLTKTFGEEKPTVEETKATLFGVMGLYKVSGEIPNFALKLAAYLTGEIIRRFMKRAAEDPTVRPYLNEAKCIALALIQDGILGIKDGKIYLNQELCQDNRAILEAIREPANRLRSSYHSASLKEALRFADTYSPDINDNLSLQALFKAINQNLEQN